MDPLVIAMESKSRVEVLEDRFDRHLDKIDKMADKVDALNDNIASLKIDLVDRINNAKEGGTLKQYSANAGIAGALYALIELLKSVFHVKNGN